MKSNYLCMQRTEETLNVSLEYAANFLTVDLYINECYSCAATYSIRIYSSTYRLMGTASYFPQGKRVTRHFHFDVQSVDKWEPDLYKVFVFRNDVPQWVANVDFYQEDDRTERANLLPISSQPLDAFFVSEICLQNWWNAYECFRFNQRYANHFVDQLRLLTLSRNVGSVYPCYFVVGPTLSAERFASNVVLPFLSKEDAPSGVHIHLAQFLKWVAKVDRLVHEINQHKFVLLNFTGLSELWHGEYFMYLLLQRIEQKRITSKVIFYGAEKDVDKFRAYHRKIDTYYNRANTFVLPYRDESKKNELRLGGLICGPKMICGRGMLTANDPDDLTPEEMVRAQDLMKAKLKEKYQERLEENFLCGNDPDLFFDLMKEVLQEGVDMDDVCGDRVHDSDPFRSAYTEN